MALARAGSELVRVTVNNDAAAKAVPHIVEGLERLGEPVPIIGDFHYNGHILLKKYPACARALAKYRINPGNVSIGQKDDGNFRTMIEVAIENDKPVRIGVNWGSLDQALLTRLMDENSKLAEPKDARDVTMEAMVQSALRSAELAVNDGMRPDRIILSAKVSGVQDLIDVYRELARRCQYPLHLGLTEAGMGSKGTVSSARHWPWFSRKASATPSACRLTPAPNGDRTEEVTVAQQILQSLGIRSFTPQVTACPGCGRTTSTFFQEMAEQIQAYLREQMPVWKTRYSGVEQMKVAVMGCVVNGPGESKHSNIGISLAGDIRGAQGPGVRGRPIDVDAERRPHRRRVYKNPQRLRRVALRPQAATGHQQLGPFWYRCSFTSIRGLLNVRRRNRARESSRPQPSFIAGWC